MINDLPPCVASLLPAKQRPITADQPASGSLLTRSECQGGIPKQKLPFARRVASEFHLLDKGHRVAGGSFGELTTDVVREHLSV